MMEKSKASVVEAAEDKILSYERCSKMVTV